MLVDGNPSRRANAAFERRNLRFDRLEPDEPLPLGIDVERPASVGVDRHVVHAHRDAVPSPNLRALHQPVL